MRTRITSLFVVALLVLLLGTPAWADLLYDNGPEKGSIQAWVITAGTTYQISDSFTLSSSSILTAIQVGLWLNSEDLPLTVDWSIGTDHFLSDIGYGTDAPLTNVPNPPRNFTYESTFSLTETLDAGTYWLTLQNAETPRTIAGSTRPALVAWDQNNGPSQAWSNIVGDLSVYTPPGSNNVGGSESFQIYGTAVPEPSTMLLLGSGLIGLAGYGRKKFFKK